MSAYRVKMTHRPPLRRHGEQAFLVPRKLVERTDEFAVTFALICNRRLFGSCYRNLMPEHFEMMGKDGGVMIAPFVPTAQIIPKSTFPGDIDLLIIPYDGDDLFISETLAVEIKVVRATYLKQGKAPNEFGFSQAKATLSQGFPFAAVAHLIVSDTSPAESWRQMGAAKVLDAKTGAIGPLCDVHVDMLPADLINRSFGRLTANCVHDPLGLLSAYVSFTDNNLWLPSARKAAENPDASQSTMERLATFFETNFFCFLDTPKYYPSSLDDGRRVAATTLPCAAKRSV